MLKAFAGLAIANLLVLTGTAGLGLVGGSTFADRHIVLAVFSLVLTCLVQVVVFTYFTISGKMMHQAVWLGDADEGRLNNVSVYKRSVSRLLGVIVVAGVLAAATGGIKWGGREDFRFHLLAAFIILTAHAVVLYKQFDLIARNSAMMERIMTDFSAQGGLRPDRIRTRALPNEDTRDPRREDTMSRSPDCSFPDTTPQNADVESSTERLKQEHPRQG